MSTRTKEIAGSEVDKDQHAIMKGLRRWTKVIAGGLLLLFLAFVFWGWMAPSQTNTAGRAQTTTVSINANCPKQAATKTFGAGSTQIGSQSCQLRAYIIAGCGAWLDAFGKRLAHSCKGPMPSIDGIMHFAADGSATLRVNHCDPWSPGNNVDICGS